MKISVDDCIKFAYSRIMDSMTTQPANATEAVAKPVPITKRIKCFLGFHKLNRARRGYVGFYYCENCKKFIEG